MKNKHLKKGFFVILYALLLLVISTIGGQSVLPAFADDIVQYSGVLDDLQIDNEFDIANYPENAKDYSVYVIQIAESTAGELFVYTYQPCQSTQALLATDINMSLSEELGRVSSGNESGNGSSSGNESGSGSSSKPTGPTHGGGVGGELGSEGWTILSLSDETQTNLYTLTLLDCYGTLCKYKVNDFTVSAERIRYYNITSIYREWLKGIDEETGNDNTKSAVAFAVGKCFKAITKNGTVVYSCEERKVVEILNPYAGFIRYRSGFGWHKTACDSHYVAFSTDMKIDDLYEAELDYVSYDLQAAAGIPDFRGVEGVPHYIVLTDDEEYRQDGKWWLFGESAEYSRIQTAKEFLANETLTDSVKKNLQDKQWVLRFAETDYTSQKYGSSTIETYTWVTDVTILRLKFKSAGVVYNLGAVSDKVSGSGVPSNPSSEKFNFGEWLKDQFKGFDFWQWLGDLMGVSRKTAIWIFVGIIVLLCLGVVLPILAIIFPPIREALKAILNAILRGLKAVINVISCMFYALWWLICLPFKGIAALFKRKKDGDK